MTIFKYWAMWSGITRILSGARKANLKLLNQYFFNFHQIHNDEIFLTPKLDHLGLSKRRIHDGFKNTGR